MIRVLARLEVCHRLHVHGRGWNANHYPSWFQRDDERHFANVYLAEAQVTITQNEHSQSTSCPLVIRKRYYKATKNTA